MSIDPADPPPGAEVRPWRPELTEADARPVPEVAKKHGVSAQTIYGWRKHFGTLEPADVKRLRQLEQENGRLKKVVADLTLDLDILKEVSRKTW
jgi:putative transposase